MSLQVIELEKIRENPVALRAVNRQSEEYHGLVASIKEKGFLGAITVREKTEADSGNKFYELVDGLHRFAASKDAGLTKINVDVVEMSDDAVMEAQIMANIHKVETRPIDYSKQLLRILNRNPMMTSSELANKLGKSPQWIDERLNLTKIANEKIQNLINEGKIGLANAYALAKLPPEEMADFVDRAMTEVPDVFIPAVTQRVKEIREAKRKGEDAAPQEFQPVAFLQKLKDLKSELDAGAVADALIAQTGVKNAKDGFLLALRWVLHLDPKSIEAQKSKDDERKSQRDEQRKKKEAERAKKKADKAAEKATEAAKAAEDAAKAIG